MPIKTILSSLLITLLLTLAGCSDSGKVDKPQPPELTDRVAVLMGGWPHAKVITEAGKATAFRIDKDDEFKEIVLSEGISLTDAQRQTLVDLLSRDDAYDWDYAKGCMPRNGVLVTFDDGTTSADVRFCFSCKILTYKPGLSEDFDRINAQLVQWVKGVFPDDEVVQSLGTDEQTDGL